MCTAITYQTKQLYFGRTLDYECSYGEQVTVTPRNYPFDFRHAGPVHTHYAMIGMAHVADVDRGNTSPYNQTVGTDQPEDPGIIVVPPEEPATPDANQGLDPATGEPLPMGG